jgi:hypothetical protein
MLRLAPAKQELAAFLRPELAAFKEAVTYTNSGFDITSLMSSVDPPAHATSYSCKTC